MEQFKIVSAGWDVGLRVTGSKIQGEGKTRVILSLFQKSERIVD
jgi:hypothetical protein